MRKPSTTKPVEKRELDSFAPAVYLEFIRNNMLLFGRDVVAEFIRIEAEIEYESLRKQADQIIGKGPLPKHMTPEELVLRVKESLKDSAKLESIWARQEELRAIMFPDTTPEAIEARREAR